MTTSYLNPARTAVPAAPRSGPATDQAGPFATIWRRRRLFAAVFIGVMSVAIGLLMVAPVQYLAVGSVIVAEPEPGSNNANASVAWIQKLGDPADIESQMLVIRAPRIMRLVASGDVVEKVVAECRQIARGGLLASLLPPKEDGCDKLRGNTDLVVDYLQRRYVVTGARASSTSPTARRTPRPPRR
jgi:succinoglycan biosynthesis transport protein ExoP